MHNSFNVFLQKLKQLSQFYSSLAVQIPVGKKKKKKLSLVSQPQGTEVKAHQLTSTGTVITEYRENMQ